MTVPACWLVGAAAAAVQARLAVELAWPLRAVIDEQGLALALRDVEPPWPPRILLLASPSDRPDEAELAIRAELNRANLPFQVLFADGGNHLSPVRRALGLEPTPTRTEYAPWSCEACSDPVCEHRLFQRLLAEKNRP